MSELSTLLANQQGLLERLKVLDGVGAGRKKDEIAAVKNELQAMTAEADRLYSDSRDRLLDAIKKQRWFFIKISRRYSWIAIQAIFGPI